MIPDYRKDFRESDLGKRWLNIAAEAPFQEALRIALLTLPMPHVQDMSAAAANEYRRQGAELLAKTLCSLSEIPIPRKPDNSGTLFRT